MKHCSIVSCLNYLEMQIWHGMFPLLGISNCQTQIPFYFNSPRAEIYGIFGNVPDVAGVVPIRLTFENAVDITMHDAEGLGINTEVAGTVSLISDPGENIPVDLGSITIHGAGEGNTS